jgi:hypothetical protein
VDRDVPIAIVPENVSHYCTVFIVRGSLTERKPRPKQKKKNAAPWSGVSVKI